MSTASVDAALGSAVRVLLDTSCLIAFHNPLEQAHPLARRLPNHIERDEDPLYGYYSVVSAAELR